MNMHKGLLIIAHGSPRKEANEEFIELALTVRSRLPDTLVQHAFLDCEKPTIAEGIDILAGEEVKEIAVLPYFLVAGKHTTQDIQAIVEQKRKEHPSVKILLKPPIGSAPEMIELISRSALF